MSITKITPNNIERYSLLANPRRTYKSASSNVSHVTPPGITGALPLFSDGSSTLKDVYTDVGLYASMSNDDNIENLRSAVAHTGNSQSDFYEAALLYMSGVHAITGSTKFAKKQNVIRFEPSVKINPDFQRKRVTKDILFPFYRSAYPTMQWNYTNYHSLNFVTSSYLPSGTCIAYPAGTGTVAFEDTNFYAPSSSFTFDFYINPRHTVENVGEEFKAGTIFHLSSSYAISLITGTSKSPTTAKPDTFRLLLQLSQSSEIAPSSVLISGNSATAPSSTADTGFLFVSNENSLKYNVWQHVAIRWDPNVQHGTGSFVVDGKEQGIFVMTSASVMAPIQTAPEYHDSDVLFIGNFFEGSNSDTKPIAGYFSEDAHNEFGVLQFNSDGSATDPSDAQFNHALNAEVHDLKIFDNYRSIQQILTSSKSGFGLDPYFSQKGVIGTQPKLSGTAANEGLLFYVPPFFVKESPTRFMNQTPFFYATGSSDDPFNVALSFGVAGHEINLQNFTREFVRGFYPRHIGLEPSRIDNTTSVAQTANYWIYESGSNRKRNVTVLPCDNGRFSPNFHLLLSGNLATPKSGSVLEKFQNEFGNIDLSLITLKNMVFTGSLPAFDAPNDVTTLGTSAMLAPLLAGTPEDPSVSPGNILTILQRTKDPDSNEVVFFDVSNMFYGDMLKPKSIVLKDLAVTGTNGRMQITLKDDGYGNLYRADSLGPHATWASVGNVIYEEGIIVVKSPNLPLFGSDAWELSFEGQRNIHVLEVNVPVQKGYVNSSSNLSYRDLIPSDYPSEIASSFVYLTGMQLHDENLNVVGRANFAQPVIKRDGDRMVIRLRLDF